MQASQPSGDPGTEAVTRRIRTEIKGLPGGAVEVHAGQTKLWNAFHHAEAKVLA